MSSYAPSSNEIGISGLDMSSGGESWAGETVIIPLTVSSPSWFYVLDTNGDKIKADSITAAQLYATSIAIRDLNYFYGPGQAYSYPHAAWQRIVDLAQSDFTGESLLNLIEGFGSLVPSLLVPGSDVVAAAGINQGLASTYLTVGVTSYAKYSNSH